MDEENDFKENKKEFAINNVIEQIKIEMKDFIQSKDEIAGQKLTELIQDRDKIYTDDENIINKYFNMKGLN